MQDSLKQSLSDRFKSWAWWEWVLFLPALIVHAVAISAPWVRSNGILKLFLSFMVMWSAFGAIATQLDSAAGTGIPEERRYFYTQDGSEPYRRSCFPPDGPSGFDAGLPLGKLYLWGTTCAAYIPYQVGINLGLDSVASNMAHTLQSVRLDYWVEGSFSLSYLWLGIVVFWTVATLPLWLVLILFKLLFSNLNIAWGD